MNLTKYFMLEVPVDNSIGPTDMPSIWNLKKYKPEQGMLMNLAGDSYDAHSVIIDSALGLLGAPPHNKQDFMEQVAWLEKYLSELPAQKYPLPIDQDKASGPYCDAGCNVISRIDTPSKYTAVLHLKHVDAAFLGAGHYPEIWPTTWPGAWTNAHEQRRKYRGARVVCSRSCSMRAAFAARSAGPP